MAMHMKLSNLTIYNLHCRLVVFGLLWIFSANAQQPSEFKQYKERFPSNPFIGLTDMVTIDVKQDKKGVPYFITKESASLLVLGDNCNYISEVGSYFNSLDEIKKVEAYSLVPENGEYRKIMSLPLKKTTEQDEVNYFDDTYCMSGHYPSTSKGSVLCKYNEYRSNRAYLGYNHIFGASYPIEKSEITISVPVNIKMIFRFSGKDTSAIQYSFIQKGDIITHKWYYHNIPGYNKAESAPSFRYFVPHLIIQVAGYTHNGEYISVMSSAKDLHKWEYEKLGKINADISPFIKQLADSITCEQNIPEEKVKTIYRWVQENIKYIAIEDGENGFIPRNAQTVIQNRYGDCKDKSSTIVALIRAIGEQASFATVGTRSLPYKFSEIPFVGAANHMIAIWWKNDTTPIPLDGTSRYTGIYNIPNFIQGKECFIVKNGKEYKIYPIPATKAEDNLITDSIKLQLKANNLIGKGLLKMAGNNKADLMYELDGKDSKQINDIISSYLNFAKNKINIKSYTISGQKNPEELFTLQYDFELPDICVTAGKRLYVNLSLHQIMNELILKTDRKIPFELESTQLYNISTQLEIPDNYLLKELPASSNYSNPLFSFSVNYKQSGSTIEQATTIRTNFLILEGKEMSNFTAMLNQLKSCYRQSIVFEIKQSENPIK